MGLWYQGKRALARLFILSLIIIGPVGPVAAQALTPVVEWQLDDGTTLSASSGGLGNTGVTIEVRQTAVSHGTRYDVRLRNRTGTDYTHKALKVRLPRAGSDAQAVIEGLGVALPAEVSQRWDTPPIAGAKYGFSYVITGAGAELKRVGPSATEGQWGGRTNGIVRIDNKAYVVPEFWERQPRRVTVTLTGVVLTLFEGSEPLRAGEDVWDRFAILDAAGLADTDLVAEAEGLPELSFLQRQLLMERFGIAPEGLIGTDADSETWLRKYDQWQGTSWEKRYADDLSGRSWAGEEESTRTTLFSLFERGFFYAVPEPGTYGWRDYGDIQWNQGMSDLHYDWLRAALKHYLRTGNRAALRWAMAAMRHAVSVDHVWESPATPARSDYLNIAGLARYEKGDHGGHDFVARPTHTWATGLFMAAAITGDPWVRETAVDVAEGTWRYWGGDAPAQGDNSGETRAMTWPLLAQVAAFRETANIKYWDKARQLMGQVLAQEIASGQAGYITQRCGWGYENNAQPLMNGYSVPGMIAFAEEAKKRGEWTTDYMNLMKRWATFMSTPVPNGAYFPDGSYFSPADVNVTYGSFAYFFCPPGLTCIAPTSTSGEAVYNMMIADLFAWLAVNDPDGANLTTGTSWRDLVRVTFYDAIYHAPQPYGIVGFLTNQYPTTETKTLGWMQLFLDRTAMWLGSAPPRTCTYMISPANVSIGAQGGTGTITVTSSTGCGWTASPEVDWVTIATSASGSGSATVTYVVAPNTGVSSRTGSIKVGGSGLTIEQSAAIPGKPIILVDPISLEFGIIKKGSPITRELNVSNRGGNPLSIVNVRVAGADPKQFGVTTNCSVVSPGASCTIGVTFAPTAKGTKRAIIRIRSNDHAYPTVSVNVTGTAVR